MRVRSLSLPPTLYIPVCVRAQTSLSLAPPLGLVESLNMEPSFESLKNFMGGVVEQGASGSADAQLACFGREDGVCLRVCMPCALESTGMIF